MSENSVILLVEDNRDDGALTLRALSKNNIKNEVVIARDGFESLDYLFGRGPYCGRDADVMPQIVLLDLKLPKVDGLEVLKHLRADVGTRLLPIVILTSSNDEQDRLKGYSAVGPLLVGPERASTCGKEILSEYTSATSHDRRFRRRHYVGGS